MNIQGILNKILKHHPICDQKTKDDFYTVQDSYGGIQRVNQTEDPLCYVKGDTCDKNSPKCIMADSCRILFQREQFLVLPEENIRLSRIANRYEEIGDEEQQHVEEEMEEELNLAALPPRLLGVSLSG